MSAGPREGSKTELGLVALWAGVSAGPESPEIWSSKRDKCQQGQGIPKISTGLGLGPESKVVGGRQNTSHKPNPAHQMIGSSLWGAPTN